VADEIHRQTLMPYADRWILRTDNFLHLLRDLLHPGRAALSPVAVRSQPRWFSSLRRPSPVGLSGRPNVNVRPIPYANHPMRRNMSGGGSSVRDSSQGPLCDACACLLVTFGVVQVLGLASAVWDLVKKIRGLEPGEFRKFMAERLKRPFCPRESA
jgi:hypothetical protein